MGNHATHNLQVSDLSVPLIFIFLSIPYCPINSITKGKKKTEKEKDTIIRGWFQQQVGNIARSGGP